MFSKSSDILADSIENPRLTLWDVNSGQVVTPQPIDSLEIRGFRRLVSLV